MSDPAGAAPTFSVFLEATGTIPFAPAASRAFVRFKDPAGGLHGSTSVAVEDRVMIRLDPTGRSLILA